MFDYRAPLHGPAALHFYSSSSKTVLKAGGLGSRDGICLRARTGRGSAVNSRGGSARAGEATFASSARRAEPRHACHVLPPRLTRRRLAGSSPASESDPRPSRSPGQRQGEDCLRTGATLTGSRPHVTPSRAGLCLCLCPPIRPSVYISSGGGPCGVLSSMSCCAMGAMSASPLCTADGPDRIGGME